MVLPRSIFFFSDPTRRKHFHTLGTLDRGGGDSRATSPLSAEPSAFVSDKIRTLLVSDFENRYDFRFITTSDMSNPTQLARACLRAGA